MNPFKVFIPTTRGAVRVLSITGEAPEIRSVICIAGSFEALPISGSYDQFVRRPTGVIEKLLGKGSYRTDLDGPVTQGDSWQFGILLAHMLEKSGRLVDSRGASQGNGVIWASGEVSPALDIRPVDYMRQKFSESRAKLQALHDNGETVTVLLHPSNREEIADLIPEGWVIIEVERVSAAAAAIGVEIVALSAAIRHQSTPAAPLWRPVSIAIAPILLALCLIGYHFPVQALKNAYSYEQAGQHRALLMEIRTNLALRNWVVTNAFYFFEVFYLGAKSKKLASSLDITLSKDDGQTADTGGACGEALAAIHRIDGVFPMLPNTGCRVRLTVENKFSHKVRVWLAVTSQNDDGMPEVKFRSGADLLPGDRYQTPSFVVTNAELSLYTAVSDRPDFGWRKWFENMIETPNATVQRANFGRLTDSGIGVFIVRQPEAGDFN